MSPRFSIRPLSTMSDRRLAELAGGGDERAFEALIGRHRVELERFCWRMGLPGHRAEDVLQQALTRAWFALRDGSDVGQPRAWLYRIVRNAALNSHRSARLRTHESIDATAGSLAFASSDDLENRLLAMEALSAVAALPDMQRQAVVMTAIEGRSHEEAAGELGVSDGAVRGLLHRARTKLRAAAAALSPQGLLELLGRASSSAPLAERPLEAGAGTAGVGLAGVLAKGAAVTVVAGLLAGGAVTQLHHARKHQGARRAATADLAAASPAVAAARAPIALDEAGARSTGRSRAGGQLVAGSGAKGRTRSGRDGSRGGSGGSGTRELQRTSDRAFAPEFEGRDGGSNVQAGDVPVIRTRDGGNAQRLSGQDSEAGSGQSRDGSEGSTQAVSTDGQAATEGSGGGGSHDQTSGSPADTSGPSPEPYAGGSETGGSAETDGSTSTAGH